MVLLLMFYVFSYIRCPLDFRKGAPIFKCPELQKKLQNFICTKTLFSIGIFSKTRGDTEYRRTRRIFVIISQIYFFIVPPHIHHFIFLRSCGQGILINLSDTIKYTLHSLFYKPINSVNGSKAWDNKACLKFRHFIKAMYQH